MVMSFTSLAEEKNPEGILRKVTQGEFISGDLSYYCGSVAKIMTMVLYAEKDLGKPRGMNG